jgi:hypothetical protein
MRGLLLPFGEVREGPLFPNTTGGNGSDSVICLLRDFGAILFVCTCAKHVPAHSGLLSLCLTWRRLSPCSLAFRHPS